MDNYCRLQEFYGDYWKLAKRWLNWPEREAMQRYFLDEGGKLRLHEPTTTSVVETVADILFNRGRDKHFPTLDFALRAAERGFGDGLAKLAERLYIVETDKQEGIRSDNSLGLIKIDLSLIRLLRENGLGTVRAVKLAPDTTLLAIRGIAGKRLREVRSVMSFISTKLDFKRAKLASGQASLF
ncbi:MAG: hypothetical protein AAB613_00790 [Patescibacteria group bacterium]